MTAIAVTIVGSTTGPDGISVPVTIAGNLTVTGLGIGGGPIIPPDVPTVPPGGEPQFPIVLPPGTPPFNPEAPEGYPPMIGGGPIVPDIPPDPSKPPLFIPVWLPGTGWVVIPGFPVPTPSGRRQR
jgi:hypothetical protein